MAKHKNVYSWRTGSRRSADPQEVGEFFQSLLDDTGKLLPGVVVAKSRSKNAVLHGEFDWDDSSAAHTQRLNTAREIIRGLVLVLHEAPEKGPTRGFVSVVGPPDEDEEDPEAEPERIYMHIRDVMRDKKLRAQLVAEAHIALEAWRRKYNRLEEFAKVFAAMDKL